MSTTRKCFTKLNPSWLNQYDSQAFGNSDVVVASGGALQSLFITNKAASGVLYTMFFDALAVPSNGAVPAMAPLIVAPGTTQRIQVNDNLGSAGYDGVFFNTGIVWAASTTAGTLTVDATSSIWLTARYSN